MPYGNLISCQERSIINVVRCQPTSDHVIMIRISRFVLILYIPSLFFRMVYVTLFFSERL